MKRVIIAKTFDYIGYSIEETENGYRIKDANKYLNNVEYISFDEATSVINDLIKKPDSMDALPISTDINYMKEFEKYTKRLKDRIIKNGQVYHKDSKLLKRFFDGFVKRYPNCNLELTTESIDNGELYLRTVVPKNPRRYLGP